MARRPERHLLLLLIFAFVFPIEILKYWECSFLSSKVLCRITPSKLCYYRQMRRSLISLLACPNCRAAVYISADDNGDAEITTGSLSCSKCSESFPIDNGIPRLLPKTLLEAQRDEMKARDDQVAQYDSNTFLKLFGKFEIPKTLRELAPSDQDRLLEAGCGTGRMTQILAETVEELISVDFSFESLQSNRQKLISAEVHNVDLVQADICNLPFLDSIFDRALSCQVLEHVPGDHARRQAIESIGRVTHANATIVISAYQHHAFMGAKEGRHGGGIPFFRFTKSEFKDTLRSAMAVEYITGSLGYLYLARCRNLAAVKKALALAANEKEQLHG
jgi:ubiquinone/menaquinone biosynthesis C-methylase UbiE